MIEYNEDQPEADERGEGCFKLGAEEADLDDYAIRHIEGLVLACKAMEVRRSWRA